MRQLKIWLIAGILMFASQALLAQCPFSVTVRDTMNCVDTTKVYLAVRVSPNGPTNYLWSTGATTRSILVPRGATYTVTVTRAGCVTQVDTFAAWGMGAWTNLVVSDSVWGQQCGVGNVITSVFGGTPPYNYQWSNGATTPNVTGLLAGQQLAVSDITGCITTMTPNISTNNSLSLNILDSTQCGDTLVRLYANVAGNVSGLTYLWSNGATTASMTTASGGYHRVTVTAANGCQDTLGRYAFTRPALNVISTVTSQVCNRANVSLNVFGGSGWLYTYQWSNGATTQSVQQIASGARVTVTDGGNCVQIHTPNIPQGFPVLVGIIDTSTCADTLAHLFAQYQTNAPSPNIRYQWSTGATTQTIYAQRSTMVGLTVTDLVSGCSGSTTFSVPSQTAGSLQISSSVNQQCAVANVSATVSGGQAPYSYLWSNGATTQNVQQVAAGVRVTVTDASGCFGTHQPFIAPDSSFSIAFVDSTTCADTTASIQAYPVPFVNNATYLWSNGETNSFIQNVPRGATYSVTVTLPNGCSASNSINISTAPANPMQVSSIITRSACNAQGLGAAVDLTVVGGQPPYRYFWSNGQTTQDPQNLTANAAVTVVDSTGCSVYHNPNIAGGIAVSHVISATSCSSNNGRIQLFVTNGTGVTYLWSNGRTTSSISGLASGWYGVTITRPASGCTYINDYFVGSSPNCQCTITGRVYNATASQQCALPLPNIQSGFIRISNNANNTVQFVPVQNGVYTFRTTTPAVYTLRYQSQYNATTQATTLCPINGSHSYTVTGNGCNIAGGDFFISYPDTNDILVDIFTSGATPGFTHSAYIRVCNFGAQPATGVVTYNYPQVLPLPYSYSYYNNFIAVAAQQPNTITFNYTNVPIGTCQMIATHFTAPVGLTLGSTLTHTVTATQAGDGYLANNTDFANVTVMGAYDPNDKRMMRHRSGDDYEGGILPSDVAMEYIIRFQNTGNAPARRVVVRDTLESNLLPETVHNLQMSHNGYVTIENGNEIVVTFDDIYLPDSSSDAAGSIGYIKFEILRNANLPLGTSIENRASIYFDYNDPIHTNYAISTLEEIAQSVENQRNALQVRTMPNPFNTQITLQFELQQAQRTNVQLYDALGRLVYNQNSDATSGEQQMTIPTAELTSGVYWLMLECAEGKFVQKVVKQ